MAERSDVSYNTACRETGYAEITPHVCRASEATRQQLGCTPYCMQAVLAEKSKISEKQLGRKIGKHAADFGLDPANSAHRAQLRHLIEEIRTSPARVIEGTFRGQGAVKFFIKGEDVVITTPTDDFVTILKGGVNNPSVRRALGI